jgi:hypothetical protein
MKDRVIQLKRVSKQSPSEDVAYWMSKSPQERFLAVEFLRSQMYETPPRLQRVFRIVRGSEKDLADIEMLEGK